MFISLRQAQDKPFGGLPSVLLRVNEEREGREGRWAA
jgi:hypothetical protein